MIEVKISPSLDALATKLATERERVLATMKGKIKRGYFSAPLKDYTGYVGELIVFSYLRDQGFKCYYKPKFDGADFGDIIVYLPDIEVEDGIGIAIEVKAAGKSYTGQPHLLVPEAQFKKRKYAAYVRVQLRDGHAIIDGYCTAKELVSPSTFGVYGTKTRDVGCAAARLRPLEGITNKIMKGRATIDLANLEKQKRIL